MTIVPNTIYRFNEISIKLPSTFFTELEQKISQFIRSDQSLSRVWLFATPWITARQASLSITNSRSSLTLTSIESVMPSNHLILCRPLLLLPPIPPSIRVFSNESTLRVRWPKYWSFSFSIIPSKEIPGLISVHMETQKIPNIQSSLEKEECSWKNQPPDFSLYYKATVIKTVWYCHKNRMEQDRKPRNKPMHLWVPYFWQRKPEYTMGQRQSLQ